MNKKIRMLCITTALLLLVGTLMVGCQTASPTVAPTVAPTEAATTAPSATVAPTPVATLAPASLIYYFPMTQPDQEIVFAAMNKYLQPLINANVDFKPISFGDWGTKMNVVTASGDPWDVSWCATWTSGATFTDLAAKGALMPLDDLLTKYAPQTYAQVPQKYWDCVKLNGKIYGVINYQLEFLEMAFAFNTDLVNKYGLMDTAKNAKTIEDLEPMLATISAKEPTVYPLARVDLLIPTLEAQKGFFEIESPYGFYFKDPTKIVNFYETPEAQTLLALKAKWYNEGIIKKGEVTISDWNSVYKSGLEFCMPINWKPGVDTEATNKWGHEMFTVPVSAPIDDFTAPAQTVDVINANSANPERAMMFINLMNTDKKLYNLMCFGIEGQHYTTNSDGTISIVKDSKYNPNIAWALGDQFNALVMKGQSLDVWQQTIDANNSATANPLNGYLPDMTKLGDAYAGVSGVQGNFGTQLTYGIGDPTTLMTDYTAKMKAAGEDAFIQALQQQVNDYLANKK